MAQIAGIVVGTYTGSGAAQTVTLGFMPTLVLAYNTTDGDTIAGVIQGQADAKGFTIDTAVAEIASQGFTLSSRGFSLGTNAKANESAKAYVYVAFP